MEKKYELIETPYGFYRVKALKDFTLITGEAVKKGDIGGFVRSEDCLSHDGLCWIKDESEVWGQISGNAVVKDYTYVKGSVSGNAVVKDYGYVDTNAIVAGNAIVQAHQQICYGTVITDLLGTKDWMGALYAELGIVPKDGKVILYQKVFSTEDFGVFEVEHINNFLFELGKEAVINDANEDAMNFCGKGLYFSSLEKVKRRHGDTILECEIDVEDILTVQYNEIRARKCKVIRVVRRKK
jgi:hypothetical protein